MKLAFSKLTADAAEDRLLLSSFRDVGYDGLQLKGSQYRPYLDEPGRFLDEWGGVPGVASGLICGNGLDDEGRADLRRLFAFAEAVGSELIIFCHGVPREGLSDDDLRAFARELSAFGKDARDRGLKLSLHNHYDNPVMHRRDFGVFFDAIEDGAVGLTLDTAHLVKSGVTDVAGVIREMAGAIDNFHLKDFAGGKFKVLGTGAIEFGPVFDAIRAIGYDGWISADEESGAETLGSMRDCLAFMRAGLGTL